MRNFKWRLAAIFALIPTVFGGLSPAVAADSAPTASTYPEIVAVDELISGNSVSVADADWIGTPEPTITKQWYSCATQVLTAGDSLPAGCVAISGATAGRFTLSNAQKAKFLLVGSFAANTQTGNTPIARYSATTATALQPAPALKPTGLGSNSTVRFTSATATTANSKYTVDLTGWVTATSYTYKWYRCDQVVKAGTTAPNGCEEIIGATAASYTVTASDVDKVVTSLVTAKNATATVSTIRISSETPVMQAPVNSAPASVFGGLVAVGRTITAIDGTWLASPSPTFGYQWYSCSVAVPASTTKNAKCAVIPGATSSNYVVAASMNNKFLVVQVRATNAANATTPVSSFSASSAKVLTGPSNTVAPKLVYSQTTGSGQPIAGTTVSVTPGTWAGNPVPTKSYQWYSCDAEVVGGLSEVPVGCLPIDGATGTSISTTSAMQGKYLTVRELATNTVETKSAVTASSAYVQTKPLFDNDPVISGTPKSGTNLSISSGASATAGVPTETYAWAKCATSQIVSATLQAGCTILAGQTSNTISLNTDVEGYFIVAKVTLTNAAGQTVRYSASSAQVTGDLVNTQISKPASTKGSVQLGVAVEANDGTWTGYPQPSFEYQWYRCVGSSPEKLTTQPNDCEQISGATSKSYLPVSADAAKYLVVNVTGVQGSSRVSVWSPSSYQVLEAPSFTGSPAVGNQHVVGGANLVPAIGAIRGTSDPRIDYGWYRCSAPVADDSAALAVGCLLIVGATSASYTFTSNDVGKYVLASITLTNELGSAKRYTSSSLLVNVAPVNLTISAPTSATSPAMVGVQLTEGASTWSGNPTATLSRQWFRCDNQQKTKALDVPDGCVAIGGQIQQTYTPTRNDAGKYLLVAVRGYNDHGSQTVFSPSTLDIAFTPRFSRGPILNNLRDKGKSLEVLVAETSGWPVPAKSYRWFRCENYVDGIGATLPAGCSVIPGATSVNYRAVNADIQKYILAEVKLKNTVGESTSYSGSSLQIRQIPEIADTVSITGNQWVGQKLTAVGVSVVGFPAPVTTLQWLRCDSGVFDLSTCAVAATGVDNYVLKIADRGMQIVLKVTASNEAGVTSVSSLPTMPINMAPKIVGLAPSVTGTDDADSEARAATTLTAFEGLWDATPAVNPQTGYAYQWYSCTLRHPISTTVIPPDCVAIKSQTTPVYLVKATDKEKFLGFSLKVSNGTDDVTQFSATTAKVYVVPTYMTGAKPAFAANQAASDGSPRIGYDIEANVGTWQGSPTPTYTYQWFSCTQKITKGADQLDDLCQIIYGATNRVMRITPDLVNLYLGVMIRGNYKTYFDETYTPSTANAVVSPPVNTVAPRITTRFTYVQSTLNTTEGTWTGTPAPKQTHTWWECDQQLLAPTSTQPDFCRELAGSSGSWKVTSDQNGKYLASLTISTNTAGSAKLWSASTDAITTGSVNINPPSISVVPPQVPFTGSQFASTLVQLKISDAVAGDWVGTPTPDLSANVYSWYRCETQIKNASDLLGSSCQLIELNATGQTYTPVTDDVGKYLVGSVKNDNGVGASIVYSASTEAILTPPNNTIVPTISGKAFVDQPLTGDKGTWDGNPTPTFALQWLACDGVQLTSSRTAPSGCVVIDKATNATFIPTDDLLGKYLVLRVTATNKVGEQVVWSASSAAVVSGPVKKQDPRFTYPATITTPVTRLNPIVGKDLSTDGGVWKGVPAPAKSYEWILCPAALTASATAPAEDKKCEVVPNSNSDTITPTETMRGKFLLVHVHAANENGEADFYSATTTVVWMAPVVEHAVAAVGTAFHRLTVKAKLDVWKAFPDVSKTYEWYVCPTAVPNYSTTLPVGCNIIAGATSSKFKIPDVSQFPYTHQFLIVKIRVTNAVDSSEHYSATSEEIQLGPVNEKTPTIAGTANFNVASPTTLTGNGGTWSPADSTLSYQWYRCASVLVASDELDPKCEAIQGAIALSYQLTEVDPGKSLMLAVTGAQGDLRSTAYSASTSLVTERARNAAPPTITGVPRANETSTGVDGDWRGFPAVVKTRTWYACAVRPMTAGTTLPATCKLLSGATTDTLTNDADLIGKYLVYSVSASNKVGTVTTKVTAYSAGTEAVADPPVFSEKPTLIRPNGTTRDDAPTVGSIWDSKASWTNKVVPTLSYKWYRCVNQVDTTTAAITAVPDGCVEIEQATESKYTIRVDDRNKFILVSITGRNAAGEATQYSNSTEYPVAQAPVADPLPSISGSHVSGSVLTIDPGVWTPVDPAPTITYNWYSCPAPVPATTSAQPPATCRNLSIGTSTYTISDLDNGSYITAQVVGTSASGRSVTSYFIGVTDGTSKAPVLTTSPRLVGDSYLVGMVLTAAKDQWDAMPEPSKAYQWYSCTARVATPASTLASGCSELSGATQSTYQIGRDDLGDFILVRVTATNSAGSAVAYSASTDIAVVAGYDPVTSVAVTAIGGNTTITDTSDAEFSQTVGTWSHGNDTNQPITNHRWVFCSQPIATPQSRFPDNCDFVYGYTGSGNKLDVRETQNLTVDFTSNLGGYYIASVEYVLKPGSNPLYDTYSNRQAFRISKTSAQLLVAPRIWDDNPGFTEPTVTAGPVVGVESVVNQVIDWQTDTDPFSLTPLAHVTWRGVEAGDFDYQWFSCDTKKTAFSKTGLPSDCVNIPGAIGVKFTPTVNEVRKFIGAQIIATNHSGTSSVWTKTSEKVTQKPTIVVGSEPSLNNITFTQDTATVNKGVWQGDPAPTFTYQWMFCSKNAPTQIITSDIPAECQTIGTPTTDNSIVVPTLNGKNLERKLAVQVIATNKPFLNDPTPAEGRVTAFSGLLNEKPFYRLTTPVAMTSSPTTSSFAPNVGETITMTNDQSYWNATPVDSNGITFTYSWYTCTLNYTALNRSDSLNSDCALIPNENSKSLALTRSLAGSRVLGKVTAYSVQSGWYGYATTATTPLVAEKPYNTRMPSITSSVGTQPLVNSRVSADTGEWGGFPTPNLQSNNYWWYACDTAVAAGNTLKSGCTKINQAASSTNYTPTSEQAGKYLVFSASAYNRLNSSGAAILTVEDRQYSAGFGPTLMAPEITFGTPAYTGSPHVGQTLTTTMPTVKAYPNPTSTSFEWYSCPVSPGVDNAANVAANCTKIGDTNQASITIDDTMVGQYIDVYAVSTNSVKTVRKNTLTTKAVTKSPANDLAPIVTGTAVADGTNKLSATAGRWSANPAVAAYGYTWYLCSTSNPSATSVKPASCGASGISSTTTTPAQIALTRDMSGKFLVLEETATQVSNNIDSNKTGKIYSASSSEILSKPQFDSNATFSGILNVGEELTADPGVISGNPTPTVAYQWYSCTTAVTSKTSISAFGCTQISGANTNKLTLSSAVVDRYITFSAVLTSSVGTATTYALSSATKVTQSPSFSSPVTLRGDTTIGATKIISAVEGTWSGSPIVAKAYNWYYCDTEKTVIAAAVDSDCRLAADRNGIAINTKTLTLVPEYRGKYIVAVETGTNASNKLDATSKSVVSASMGPITMAPVFANTPSISGTYHVGQTLTASVPTVTEFPTVDSTYEWWSCASAISSSVSSKPANCDVIPNSANSNLLLTDAMAGDFIALAVTNSNGVGVATKSSTALLDVTQSPVNNALPIISGDVVVGSSMPLAVSTGTWTSSPVASTSDYSYVWYQCSQAHSFAPTSLPVDCVSVSGQTASTILPTDSMAGKFLLAKVTLSVRSNKDGAGVASVFTSSTASILNKPQFGSNAPSIAGIAHLGETLTATLASVTGNEAPTSSYQWWQCDSAVTAGSADITAGCAAIDGSNDSPLVLTSGMVGKRIAVLQTATNNQGSISRSSATTLVVSSTPSVTAAPVISGSDIYSSTAKASVTSGTWGGSPATTSASFAYLWYYCTGSSSASNTIPSGCTSTALSTNSVSLSQTWVGKYLVVRVTATTATNKPGTGTATTYSAAFGPIRIAPSVTAAPSFTPTSVVVGRTITANPGTWSGTGPISTSYKWYYCPTTATISSTAPVPSTCTYISGYDNQSLVVPAIAATKKLLLAVTATNSAGSSVASAISGTAVAAASISPLALMAIL